VVGASTDYWYLVRFWKKQWRAGVDTILAMADAVHAQETFLTIERERIDIEQRTLSPFVETAYRSAETLLQAMQDESARHHIRLLVALAPDEVQVSETVRRNLASRYSLDLSAYDWDQPNRRLGAALAARHIPVVDLLPPLRDAARTQAVYLKYNTHWNDAGNRVVSDAIWSAIASQKLLESN